ncbi:MULTISPECIES: hypothetical protein [unclassified Pseudomonas]|uniref:hypothetical protein n=1 Tax=unclassified Pseudomonas TaxID=196821 RepID=UPI0012DE26D5|nr:hypothetical protein [Pseudomonas sp. URMO17WK12:I4]
MLKPHLTTLAACLPLNARNTPAILAVSPSADSTSLVLPRRHSSPRTDQTAINR